MLRMFSLFEFGKFGPDSWGGTEVEYKSEDGQFEVDVEENDSVGWRKKMSFSDMYPLPNTVHFIWTLQVPVLFLIFDT